MKTRTPPLQPEFTFAGFTWPRYVARLERGTLQRRIIARRSQCTGEYRHAPKPNNRDGAGFYLGSDSPFDMRYEIRPTGYYCDPCQDQTISGLVFRLPRGRGFLAGWTMGENMASSIDYSPIFDSESDAQRCADSMAESVAESELEYQAQETARIEELERETALMEED